MKRSIYLFSPLVFLLVCCETTSLSNPSGRGHEGDLSLYGLTAENSNRPITERDIASASRGDARGSLPWRGARILLVQSGAYQPDAELMAAYSSYASPVPWDGRAPEKAESPGAIGKRLRLSAAQQGCSHVVVVFGEIQSDSQSLPTDSLVGWVPIVGGILPTAYSGTRVIAQAIVMETSAARYAMVSAAPRQEESLTTYGGQSVANLNRSQRMKRTIYPELAARTFR